MGTLYWSIVMLMFGACIGSFLNVVIYRWPRNLSIRRPKRSFCPQCDAAITWRDNIPVISYLMLRGRCRHCSQPISLQYPLVELATALVFVMTWDSFFVAGTRDGVTSLLQDKELLLAHLVLWSGLIAMSVMDFESYTVDIRITGFVSVAGLVLHAAWRPAGGSFPAEGDWLRPGVTLSFVCAAVILGMAMATFRNRPPEEDYALPDLPETKPDSSNWPILLIPVASVVGYLVWMAVANGDGTGFVRLGAGATALLIGLTLIAARPETTADEEMDEIIDAGAADARKVAFREVMFLLPGLALGTLALGLMQVEAVASLGTRVIHASPGGNWYPLAGLATAVSGWVVAGAIGWTTRIVFTILFGKEAFALGDVHILAAAGAVAGWPVAMLGFFFAAMLALMAICIMRLLPRGGRYPLTAWIVGGIAATACVTLANAYPPAAIMVLLPVVLIAVRGHRQAMPYGPWLAIGFFVASIYQDEVLKFLRIRWILE